MFINFNPSGYAWSSYGDCYQYLQTQKLFFCLLPQLLHRSSLFFFGFPSASRVVCRKQRAFTCARLPNVVVYLVQEGRDLPKVEKGCGWI